MFFCKLSMVLCCGCWMVFMVSGWYWWGVGWMRSWVCCVWFNFCFF